MFFEFVMFYSSLKTCNEWVSAYSLVFWISWPEIPDKMAEFEPAQRYAAFSIIIEKQT